MRVLIFGDGQLGNAFLQHFTREGDVAHIARGVDITDLSRVDSLLDEYGPDIVINAAAATSLEWCSLNRLRAFEVNVLGASNVAKACDERRVYLVHLSSGCIFSSEDATDMRREGDTPTPASYYAWTKAWGEQLVYDDRSSSFKCLTLRPRQPVSSELNHKNMLFKMLTFSKFVDTPNSGTVISDLMEWTELLVEKELTGVFHVANEGWTTPYRIGLMIRDHILPDLQVEKISKGELDLMTPNTRVDTVLDVAKLKSVGIHVASYEDRVLQTIKDLSRHIREADVSELRDQLERTAEASRQRTVLNTVYPDLYRRATVSS